MKHLLLVLCLFTCVAPVGCAFVQDAFGPQRYVLPGPDQVFGTEDDEIVEGPSKAQETLDAARPLADAFGFGHYVALAQAGLAIVTIGVGATMPAARKEDEIGDPTPA